VKEKDVVNGSRGNIPSRRDLQNQRPEIKVVNWDRIAEGDWQDILASIPIGGCVEALPYKANPTCVSLKFGIESGHVNFKAHNSCEVDLQSMMRVVEFTRYVKLDGTTAYWKRTQ
jgi:hypothetical protein